MLHNDNDCGEIDPTGVHFPILDFALRHHETLIESANAISDGLEGDIEEFRQKRSTVGGKIKDVFNGKINDEIAKEMRNKLKKTEDSIQRAADIVAVIKYLIDGRYIRIVNGKTKQKIVIVEDET